MDTHFEKQVDYLIMGRSRLRNEKVEVSVLDIDLIHDALIAMEKFVHMVGHTEVDNKETYIHRKVRIALDTVERIGGQ